MVESDDEKVPAFAFDPNQMREDAIRIHADAIYALGGDPVHRSYVDALLRERDAARARAEAAEREVARLLHELRHTIALWEADSMILHATHTQAVIAAARAVRDAALSPSTALPMTAELAILDAAFAGYDATGATDA